MVILLFAEYAINVWDSIPKEETKTTNFRGYIVQEKFILSYV